MNNYRENALGVRDNSWLLVGRVRHEAVFSISESQESNQTMQTKNCVPLLYYDWLKKPRTTFLTNQQWKQKTNHYLVIFISFVWRSIHVLASRCDWFIWLSILIVIGQNKSKRVSLTHVFPPLVLTTFALRNDWFSWLSARVLIGQGYNHVVVLNLS